jgi:hypothetical protein
MEGLYREAGSGIHGVHVKGVFSPSYQHPVFKSRHFSRFSIAFSSGSRDSILTFPHRSIPIFLVTRRYPDRRYPNDIIPLDERRHTPQQSVSAA